jgi:hypothetical protein
MSMSAIRLDLPRGLIAPFIAPLAVEVGAAGMMERQGAAAAP